MHWLRIISELAGGLGLFLFGMLQMEEALKILGGRSFKLFLKKHTENKFKAISSGTIVTAVLQSSSLVNLMVLAFVGAGIMTFRNAFSVTLGANLGTTLSNWILAYVGFNFKINELALPVIGIGIVLFMFFSGNNKVKTVSRFLFGFGILFLGLDFMKQSFSLLFQSFDFTPYLNYPRILFALFGFVITAIIQSSSATIVILLSALYSGVLTLPVVAAMILGAELGSSVKVILGAIGGIAEKKRLGLSNFLFNLFASILAYIFMDQLLLFIDYAGIKSPYIALVAFQTLFNIGSIILIFPFLNVFCSWMEKRYKDDERSSTYFLSRVTAPISEMATELMEKEAFVFLQRVVLMNMRAFHLEDQNISRLPDNEIILERDNAFATYTDRYLDIKKAEGEMADFYYKMNEGNLEHQDSLRLSRLMASVRNAMYAAKSIRDVYEDRLELRNALNNEEYKQYREIQEELRQFYVKLIGVMQFSEHGKLFEDLVLLLENIHKSYNNRMKELYKEGIQHQINEVDLSTLLNVNREVFSSCKALVFSVKDLKLTEEEAQSFDNIPLKVLN